MYEAIQQHNIARNKIIEQTKAHIFRVVDGKIEKMQGTFDDFSTEFKASKALLDKKITELSKQHKLTKVFLARCAQQTDQNQNFGKLALGEVTSASDLASLKESIAQNKEDMFYQF